MTNRLRRSAIGALAVGAIAGASAFGISGSGAGPAWQPTAYGLTASPAQLLPAGISRAHPVRIVTTALDNTGRPVVTAQTATDDTLAAGLIIAGQKTRNAISVEADAVAAAAAAPTGSDPSRGDQWYLARIKATQAWAKSTGKGVTVAVLDTGVDAGHPDLAGQVLAGYDEIRQTAGDGTDPSGHGTQVAGEIAAIAGNEVGISGVAPSVKILPVRVLSSMETGYASDIAAGIIWAADHGANVINMSFSTGTRVSAVTNAIAYARSKGVVLVAAGGNSRIRGNQPSYPGAEPSVIAVAATEANDQAAIYSTAASYVDVAAPGGDILSTYPGGEYRAANGTSTAAAQVSAIAALVKAVRPALNPDQVEWVIEGSATNLGVAGKDADFGYGLVDAAAAVDLAAVRVSPSRPPSGPIPTPAPPKTRMSVLIKAAAPISVVYGTNATVRYTVLANNKPLPGQAAQLSIAATGGPGFVTTDVVADDSGVVEYSIPATGTFQVRLIVPATATVTGGMSAISTVGVVSQVDLLNGDPAELTVTYAGPPGRALQLQKYQGRLWVLVSTFVATDGPYTITGLTAGLQYRVVVPAGTGVAGAVSKAIQLV